MRAMTTDELESGANQQLDGGIRRLCRSSRKCCTKRIWRFSLEHRPILL